MNKEELEKWAIGSAIISMVVLFLIFSYGLLVDRVFLVIPFILLIPILFIGVVVLIPWYLGKRIKEYFEEDDGYDKTI